MRPPGIDLAGLRRVGRVTFVGVLLMTVAVYFVSASISLDHVTAQRARAQFGMAPGDKTALKALSDTDIARAISARPLDQVVANVAMVRDDARNGDGNRGAWMAAVKALGWRDTIAQLNRLFVAVAGSDFSEALNVSEGLIRQNLLLEQVIPILTLFEADPAQHDGIIARLANNPPWRDPYLQSTWSLGTPEQLMARYDTMNRLIATRARPTREDIAANAEALASKGRPDLGFALWKAGVAGISGPLNDPKFSRVARGVSNNVPYEWELMSGEGFSAEAFVEGGRSVLAIEWNGRGVPLFARQRTSVQPGRYALDVAPASQDPSALDAISFRFLCDGGEVVPFQHRQGGSPTQFETRDRVSCAYPFLQVAGGLHTSVTSRTVRLSGLRLSPI